MQLLTNHFSGDAMLVYMMQNNNKISLYVTQDLVKLVFIYS